MASHTTSRNAGAVSRAVGSVLPSAVIERRLLHERYQHASQQLSSHRAQQRKAIARVIGLKMRILHATQHLQAGNAELPDASKVIARLAHEMGLNSRELVRAVGAMEIIWKKTPDEITWKKSPSNYYRALLAPGIEGRNLPASVELIVRALSKNGQRVSNESIATAIGRPLEEIRPLLSASLQLLVAARYIQQGPPKLVNGKRFAMWEHRNHAVDHANDPNHIISMLRYLSWGPLSRAVLAANIRRDSRGAYLTEMSLRNYEKKLLAKRVITKSRIGKGPRARVIYALTPATSALMKKFIASEKMSPELKTLVDELFQQKARPPKSKKSD